MDIAGIRDAGANVDDLAYSRLTGQELHDAVQERPVGAGDVTHLGSGAQHLPGGRPVDGIVFFPAQVKVVHARRVRPAGVNVGR